MTTTDIPGIGAIAADEANDLLRRTDANNATGRIGGPFSRDGYTLTSALAMVTAAERLSRGVYHGMPILIAVRADQGSHVWYLNLMPRRADPWA